MGRASVNMVFDMNLNFKKQISTPLPRKRRLGGYKGITLTVCLPSACAKFLSDPYFSCGETLEVLQKDSLLPEGVS